MKKTSIILLIIVALLISGCSDNAGAILYEIENEKKIEDGSLSNSLSIASMEGDGTYLYIAAGEVYRRDYAGAEEWEKTTHPGPRSTYAGKIAVFSGTLIVINTTEDSDSRMFASETNGDSWSVDTGVTLTGKTNTSETPKNLISTEGRVFILTEIQDSAEKETGFESVPQHRLYEVTAAGVDDIALTDITDSLTAPEAYNRINPIVDIAIDGSNELWAITAAGLFTTAASAGTDLPSGSSNQFKTGIHYSQIDGNLYIASHNDSYGYVYRLNTGVWEKVNDSGLKFPTDFADITVYDETDPKNAMTLGCSSGYYEMVETSSGSGVLGSIASPEETADDNYDKTDFSAATVYCVKSFLTGAEYETFGLTAIEGLWFNDHLSWELE